MKTYRIGKLVGKPFAAVLAMATLAVSASAAPVAMPYSEDFNDAVADNFTESTASGFWALTAGTYEGRTAGNTALAKATVEVSNLGGATNTDFVLSTTATYFSSSSTNNSDTFGLTVLASNAVLTGGGAAPYYLIDVSRAGTMRVLEVNSSNTTHATASFGTLSVGTTYTLTVEGTYDLAGDLTLSFTVDDGVTSETITTAALASPLSGQYFGYRQRSGGGDFRIRYDDFNLVPEPASFALAGLGSLLIFTRRRTA